jgi:hypothetical protein
MGASRCSVALAVAWVSWWLVLGPATIFSSVAEAAPQKSRLLAKPVKPVALGSSVQLEVTGEGAAKDQPLVWKIEGEGQEQGSVDAQGIFHAPSTHATPATVRVTASVEGENPAQVVLTIPLQAVAVKVHPSSSSVSLGDKVTLEAKVSGVADEVSGVKFELSGEGAIDEKGVYTAPTSGKTPSKVSIKVTSVADPSKSSTVVLPITAVSVSAKASAATVTLGGSIDVEAKVSGTTDNANGVKYEVIGEGTIDDKGHYSAPSSGKTPNKVSIKVTSVADPSKSTTVALPIGAVSVTAKTSAPTVMLGGSVDVEAKVSGADEHTGGVKYELSGEGILDEKGHYSAPSNGKTPSKVSIKVTSVADPSKSSTVVLPIASVSVSAKARAPSAMLGGSVDVEAKVSGASEQVSGVKYEVVGDGTIDDKGHYSAPSSGKTPSKVSIKVSSVADPSKSATVVLPIAAVSVAAKPSTSTVMLGGTATVEAKVSNAAKEVEGVKYELTGVGSIDEHGLYTAPTSSKTPDKVSVRVTSVADPSKSSTFTLALAPIAISAKASSPSITLGGSTNVEANVSGATGAASAIKYEVVGEGTIDEKGHYSAPSSGKTPNKVTIKVSSVADSSKTASVSVAIAPVSVSAKPSAAEVTLGGSVDVGATVSGVASDNAGAKYAVVGEGTIDERGHFTAPKTGKTPSKSTIQITSTADPSKSATIVLPIAAVSVIAKSSSASVELGGTATIEAKVNGVAPEVAGVKFELSGEGAIDEKGVYTAPTSGKTPSKVSIKVTSVADPSKSTTVVLPIASVSVSAKASAPSAMLGGSVDVEAKVSGTSEQVSGVKYEVVGDGTIDDKGHYSAPSSGKTPSKVSIKVSSVADPSKSTTVPIAIASLGVVIKPVSNPVPVGGDVGLVAVVSGATESASHLTWSVVGEAHGTVDEHGHFVAPSTFKTPGSIVVRAASVADPSKSATVSVPIASVVVAMGQKFASADLGGDASLSAKVAGAAASAQGITWSVEGGEKNGTIDAQGHYVPPATMKTPAFVTVRATSVADASKSAATVISIPMVQIRPAPLSSPVRLGGSYPLIVTVGGAMGAAAGVDWKVESPNGGRVDTEGLYEAPISLKTPATIIVRATSKADPTKSTTLSLPFAAVSVSVAEKEMSAQLGGGATLHASVEGATGKATDVAWSVEGKDQGSIDADGHYRAPSQLRTPARVTIRATSKADPTKSATAQISFAALSVDLQPKSAEVALGESLKFSTQVSGAEGEATSVNWSVPSGDAHGTLDADGTYHAPPHGKTPSTLKVRATSKADPSKFAEAELHWPAVGVAISPERDRLELGKSVALKAKVGQAHDGSVSWTVEGGDTFGTIDAEGNFRAPSSLPEPPIARITAKPNADETHHATATIDLAVADVYSVASEQRLSGGQPGTLIADAPSRMRIVADDAHVFAAYRDGQTLLVPVSDDRGVNFKAPARLLTGKGPIAAPELVVGPNHSLWLAYRSQVRGQPGDVVVCRTPDTSHVFDPCTKPNGKTPIANLTEHALAVADDNSVSVAWIDDRPQSAQVVVAHTANGWLWETRSFTASSPHGLALSVGRDHIVVAAWVDGPGAVRLAEADFTPNPSPPTATATAAATPATPTSPTAPGSAHEGPRDLGKQLDQLFLLARDRSHLLLAANADGHVRISNGEKVVEVGAESGSTQDWPVLAADGDGVQIAFRDTRASGQSIRLTRARSWNALAFEPVRIVNALGPATRGAPSIAIDRSGRAVVAWPDGRGADALGQHQDLMFARADEHPVQIHVSAPEKPLLAGQSATLTAHVDGPSDARVRWSIDDGPGRGVVDVNGVYTAPAHLQGSPHVYVRATSVADASRSAAALVELAPVPEVRKIEPEQCGVGETVTITGAHFGTRYPGFGVRFGGVRVRESDYVSWNDDVVVLHVPPSAKSGKVSITSAGGTTDSESTFTFLPVQVVVKPAYAVIHQGERRGFVAQVQHAGDKSVRWELSGDSQAGTLSNDGSLAVDEKVSDVHHAELRAVSNADTTISTSATVITGPLGGRVWRVDARQAHGPASDGNGHYFVTNGDGELVAVDRAGKRLWQTSVTENSSSEGAPPVLRTPTFARGKLFVVVQSSGYCSEGRACKPDSADLVALQAADGQVLWHAALGEGDFSDPVALDAGAVVARYAGTLMAFGADDNKPRWSITLPKGLSTAPVLGPDGNLHGTGDSGLLYEVSGKGKLLWTTTVPEKPTSLSRPAVARDGSSYVSGDDSQLRSLDEHGHVRWTIKLKSRVPPRQDAQPVLGDGVIYAGSSSALEAFDLHGQRKWDQTCASCSAPLALGHDGVIYAGRYAPQAFTPEGKLSWSADGLQDGERWSAGVLTDEGLLLWTDPVGLSARITSSRASDSGTPSTATLPARVPGKVVGVRE